MIDKRVLLERLRSAVERDLESLARRQRDTAAGATHEESRAEHAKDTRATEQSYLARGLAERVGELERAAGRLASLELEDFAPDAPIAITALVHVEEADEEERDRAPSQIWWLLPVAGGHTLEADGVSVRTVTPSAPLGRALVGLEAGDEGRFRSPRGERRFTVARVE